MLKPGAKQMHERGMFDYLKSKWLGGEKKCRTLNDISSSNMVLTFQHVSFIFLVFGSSVALSIVLFLLEIGKRYFLKEVENSKRNSTPSKKFLAKHIQCYFPGFALPSFVDSIERQTRIEQLEERL